ncbi:hypothetical protein Val02_29370 [Virgisporangium aliadipatigenens]|uniref:Uncharacterized protein n=1 Tax=Virgisporangium aliadipatigenens TaxID=741659 RepID=A0A8J3YJ30_9ACTN|nr:hypothetical protein [Virgisporangium aliadipatigenens]GIJ46051.1 hypothetical protein Val02_29370 [Virgisporangium aliadipatigenens]
MLLRLLANRNIKPGCPDVLMAIGDGPYVAASTIYHLGTGRTVLTRQYVTAFAYVLGIPPGDLAAIVGVGPPDERARAHPDHAALARLAWDARWLDNTQLSQVMKAASTPLRDEPGAGPAG